MTCVFGFVWLSSIVCRAEIYKFVDENGVVHFTNVPTDNRYQKMDSDSNRSKNKSSKTKLNHGQAFQLNKASQYDEYIKAASRRYTIPVELIKAVIAVESNFNPKAVSRVGAQGLMQLMPKTAKEMGVIDSFDPEQNILGGTRYLRLTANTFNGDLVLTLAAYNAGHRAVSKHMDIPPYAETQRYVRRVLKLYYYYKEQSGSFVSKDSKKEDRE
jgi:soluble lytic murein transglycosylase-like protein